MNKSTLLLESEITNTLLSAGLPANLQGFHFLKDAILEVIKNPTLLHQLTKKLYPEVATIYGVSPAIVERSMRHVIETACKNGAIYNINVMLNSQYFDVNDKPCNGCFIALFAEIVRKNMYQFVANIDVTENEEKAQLVKELQESMGSFAGGNIA